MLRSSGYFFEKIKPRIAKYREVWYDQKNNWEWWSMETADEIRELRKRTGMTRKDFAMHIGIPLRTVEDWEAGRRRPPEYIPRLISYQLRYEELMKKMEEEADAGKE